MTDPADSEKSLFKYSLRPAFRLIEHVHHHADLADSVFPRQRPTRFRRPAINVARNTAGVMKKHPNNILSGNPGRGGIVLPGSGGGGLSRNRGVTCRQWKISKYMVYQLQTHRIPLTHRTAITGKSRGDCRSIDSSHPPVDPPGSGGHRFLPGLLRSVRRQPGSADQPACCTPSSPEPATAVPLGYCVWGTAF